MGKDVFKANDFAELMERYNPLAFKDEEGKIMLFKSYQEAYTELLNRLYKAGPKLIDVVVFAVDTWGMTLSDAQRFVASWRTNGFRKNELYLIDWETGGVERDQDLEQIARGCHLITETTFNKDMFKYSLMKFLIDKGFKC